MKPKKGSIFVLLLIILAAIGLYFAYVNKDIARLPTGTTGSTLAELWETNRTGYTHVPANSQPSAHSSPSQESTKRPVSDYIYAKLYQIYPGKAVAQAGKSHLIYVGANHALPARYSVRTEVCVTVYPENRAMEVTAARQFRAMYNDALKEGVELIPFSGYRSAAQQKEAFDREISALENAGLGRQEAIERVMLSLQPPGCSEHETGLAIDITRKGVWRTDPGFHGTKEFEWLQKNAHAYGFILRYPQGKEVTTGISYEPWHWRYVGVEAATEMKNSGQCLEEYLKIAR